jgi:hypothetical protein
MGDVIFVTFLRLFRDHQATCDTKTIPIPIERGDLNEQSGQALFDILTSICRFIPLTIIYLILDAAGFGLDLAADRNLERFVALQHVDRNSYATWSAQAKLVRDAGLRASIVPRTQWAARVCAAERGLAALVVWGV